MNPNPPPSLRLLSIFDAAATEQSFGGAAARIHISQPAVTQSIRRLEHWAVAELLRRNRHGCQPSEMGKILYQRTRRLFAQFEDALARPLIGPPFAEGDRIGYLARAITESQVQALAAIDATGSIERAARSLGISPPSVQRAARGLEGLLKRALFKRTTQGSATTRSGAELARRLQLALRERDYAQDELQLARDESAVRLVVGVLPMSCTAVLAAALDRLVQEFPDIRLQVQESVYQELEPRLRAGKLDMIYGVLREATRAADIEDRALFDDPYVAVVRPGHPLAGRPDLTRTDLADCAWIVPPVTSPRRQLTDAAFGTASREPPSMIETNSIATAKALLAANDRVMLLARYDAERESAQGQMAILDIRSGFCRAPTGLSTLQGWQPTRLHRRFMTLMQLEAARAFDTESPAPA